MAEGANFKGGTFNKHCNGLIGNRFEMPNVSYTHPLALIGRNTIVLNKEAGIWQLGEPPQGNGVKKGIHGSVKKTKLFEAVGNGRVLCF